MENEFSIDRFSAISDVQRFFLTVFLGGFFLDFIVDFLLECFDSNYKLSKKVGTTKWNNIKIAHTTRDIDQFIKNEDVFHSKDRGKTCFIGREQSLQLFSNQGIWQPANWLQKTSLEYEVRVGENF